MPDALDPYAYEGDTPEESTGETLEAEAVNRFVQRNMARLLELRDIKRGEYTKFLARQDVARVRRENIERMRRGKGWRPPE